MLWIWAKTHIRFGDAPNGISFTSMLPDFLTTLDHHQNMMGCQFITNSRMVNGQHMQHLCVCVCFCNACF